MQCSRNMHVEKSRGAEVVLESVCKSYGNAPVLCGIDLDVWGGSITVLIGPSGSGKSTLCRCINGIERVDSGRVVVDGQELPAGGRRLAQIRADLGSVSQAVDLFSHLSVLNNVVLGPLAVRRLPRADAVSRARDALDRVGLTHKLDSWPVELAGGERQRVAIARALAMQPRALILDEPTSALDLESTTEVLDLIGELSNEGRTMLIVTHELGFAAQVADRIAFIEHGRILEIAPPVDFFEAASSPRVAEFIAKSRLH